MMWGYGDWGWMGMLLGMLAMVIFWGGLIALVVWIVVRLTRSTAQHAQSSLTPLDIAKTRYAKGEITKEQFEQFRRDIAG